MQLAPIPISETHRLDSLRGLDILEAESDDRFDRIVRIAQHSFGVPVAFIAFVDEHHVWFKSEHNFTSSDADRNTSFCGHAICNVVTDDISSRIFEVDNAKEDIRFFDNPHVAMPEGVCYYMAFILQSKEGHNIGTLCIVDKRSRTFSEADKKIFADIGLIAQAELNNISYTQNYLSSHNLNQASNDTNFTNLYQVNLNKLLVKLPQLQKQFDTSFKSRDITFKDWCVLNEIMQLELASPNLISRNLDISRPLMSRKLDSLVIKRLIERWNANEGDRRLVYLACTKRGVSYWQKGKVLVKQLSKDLLRSIESL